MNLEKKRDKEQVLILMHFCIVTKLLLHMVSKHDKKEASRKKNPGFAD